MAGGGLDDELLALAGGSARNIDLSSDDEGDRVRAGSKRDSKPSTSSSLAKKRRLDLLDESASGSDADAPGSDDDDAAASSADDRGGLYPYQGIYKSARDMEELMSMNELEREDILAKRRDEINKRRQKVELAALVKAQRAAAGASKKAATKKRVVRGGRRGGADSDLSEQSDDDDDQDADGDSDFAYGAASAAKSRKKKLPGQTDAKSAKLSELRKKRKEKAAGISRSALDSDDDATPSGTAKSRNRRGYASSSASDVSYSDYSDEDDYPRRARTSGVAGTKADARSSGDSAEPPSLADLNAARITRDQIESRLYAPRWREYLMGSFFRFSWGQRPHASNPARMETVYRIHQVSEVVEKPGKFYDLSDDRSGKWCNVYLVFEHAGQEHDAKINMLSRGEFVESERERWLAMLHASKQRVPRKPVVARKADELDKFFTSPLTEQDIGKILDTKKRLRQEAISVMGGSAVLGATAGFDSPRGAANGSSTPTVAGGADVKPQSLEARLAAVNERNRALDRSKQSDVEHKARKAAHAARSAPLPHSAPSKPHAQQQADADKGGIQVTNEKVAHTGMGNGFVAVKNYSTLVEVDLGDF
ncbi:conserved hypothetical protein [Sporisorium reilianum SRZ2]|uniref:Plus3 domain-containing protein n=1 Tax=Sporisorium reilianum (strain SRZ2) TaxID=999809 RepID=E6ZSI5_SPORE|nr:conserved hypothetical protein [Sporisorium reilianum SRZ2]